MCGICGWLYRNPTVNANPDWLHRMNATLTHRGPDDQGAAIFDGMALAMSRLQVIDLFTGHQPIFNQRKDCAIVFNGEIYNYLDLRNQLQKLGYSFSTTSDTEVLLHAYEEWGTECVNRLWGMFAFAIYDGRGEMRSKKDERNNDSSRLVIGRDRVGKKPLYYYRNQDWFIFASEIKAILQHPSVPRRVNHKVIPLYLAHGYVPTPYTMFEGIFELPPGHILSAESGHIEIQQYWDVFFESESSGNLSEHETIEQLRVLLEQSVQRRLMSDVPLGAFLSGGLDSTGIVAVMMKLLDEPVKTFSIGFEGNPSFNELEYGRLAADSLGTIHHEFVVKPDALHLLPKIVWHYDQPFGDSSALAMHMVAKLTREHVTVALTGDGADELFAGYDRFLAAQLSGTYNRSPQILKVFMEHLFRVFPESTHYSGFVRRVRRFIEFAPRPLAEQYLGWVGVFQHSFIHELLNDDYPIDPVSHYQTNFTRVKDVDPLGQLLYVNMKTYLTGDLLVKTDRMSMANSLEVRCPYLDHTLIDFAAKIPSKLKLNGRITKYILKRALEEMVPKEIISRKKHGFGVPVSSWFRGDLQKYIKESLLHPQSLQRGYFKEDVLRKMIEEHQCGKRDHGHRLWTLLTFEMWHQIFLDQSISVGHL